MEFVSNNMDKFSDIVGLNYKLDPFWEREKFKKRLEIYLDNTHLKVPPRLAALGWDLETWEPPVKYRNDASPKI